jgi:integrase
VSLYKRGSIWWSALYVDGLRYQVSTHSRNRRLAERIEQRLREQIVARLFQIVEIDPHVRFAELAKRFTSSAEARPFHRERLKRLLPYFGDSRVVLLVKSRLDAYRRTRITCDLVVDATVNRDLSVLRRILNWAVDERFIPASPLGRLRLPPERSQPRPVMSPVEEDALLASAPIELQPLVIAALDTGMRRGELLGQRWEHVDLSRAVLFVSHSKTAAGEGREIPLTRRLYEILSASRPADGIVFRRLSVASLATAWRAALRRAQLRHFRFHDLRHTFNTRLLEAGVISDVRMALMGHVSGQKVHARYTHVNVAVKREAIARLEEWVKQQNRKGGIHGTEIETFLQSSTYQVGSKRLGEGFRAADPPGARRCARVLAH